MTDDGGYDLQPEKKPPEPTRASLPKPGEPGFVPPEVLIEKSERDEEEAAKDPDVETHKGMAVLGYVFFIIPLVLAADSKFARFHANQGLIVFILWWVAIIGVVGINIALWLLGRLVENILILSMFFSCVLHVAEAALLVGVLVIMVMGIVHAANGEWKKLPGVGHFNLIK